MKSVPDYNPLLPMTTATDDLQPEKFSARHIDDLYVSQTSSRYMTKKLEIAMIGDFPGSEHRIEGGVESVMLYLCRELARYDDVRLNVVTMDRWGLGARENEIDGFRVHYIAQSGLPSRLGTAVNIGRMRDLLRRLAPDVVHAHIAGHYSDAARLCGKPWILTLHGIRFLEARLNPGLINQIYRRHVIEREEARGIRAAPSIISINPFVDETFGDQITGKVFSIENPADDSFFQLPQTNEPFSIFYAGRLTPRKDLLTLLEAFAKLAERLPDARLRIAGAEDTGDPEGYGQQLREFVNSRSLADRVRFLGPLEKDQLLLEYARASVAVLAAVLETAPMAIAEAMAAATAVVTTDAGGCRHMVENGKTGRVVPCRDPAALADALAETLGSDGQARERGRLARESAIQRFKASSVAKRTLDVYRSVTGSRQSADSSLAEERVS